MSLVNINEYKQEVESELKDNILKFWINNTIDNENGGFYGFIANDLSIKKNAPKGSVLLSRIIWAFSISYKIYKDPEYLKIAERAYQYLIGNFVDKQYGGVFWMLDYKARILEPKKQIYAQAFAIYGLSEFYSITGNIQVLELAKDLFNCIERNAYDKKYKGYYDACSQNWTLMKDMSLSNKDLNSRKSMNTNLHIMEAYSNLLKYWKDDVLKLKLFELVNVTMNNIIDPQSYHFKLYFDDNWKSLNNHVSYGHDIEGSWLLFEAAEMLEDNNLLEKAEHFALKMADVIYNEGIDKDGGIVNEGNDKRITNYDRDWWPQAEAMVGFMNAYQLSKNEKYLEASFTVWKFIRKYFIDRKNGEWFWLIDKNGSVGRKHEKVGFWKCPYHNSRACIEIMRRIDEILKK
jgi:cellobiose epimerase